MKVFHPRGVIYVLVILIGLLSAMPNMLPATALQRLPDWLASNQLSLGLDLQGGSHLLLGADTRPLIEKTLQDTKETFLHGLRDKGIRYQSQPVNAGSFSVTLTGLNADADKASEVAASLARGSTGEKQFDVTRDQQHITFTITEEYKASLASDAIEQSLEVVRRRLNESGLVEPSITRQGNDGVLVQMPGVSDPSRIRDLLGTTAQMRFHWVTDNASSANTIVLPNAAGNQQYRLQKQVAMDGEHIKDAQLGFDPNTSEPVVTFKLDNTGSRIFAEMTKSHIGVPLAIVLDNKVLTAPVIRSVIAAGAGEISGNFTPSEAKDLALLLRAGALPVPLDVMEERTVGPDLGSDAIEMGVTTGLIGAALVFAFMITLYRRWGLIACTSLAINIGLIIGLLSAFGATLTLPGIAGIILTIGMAVDANILINERIKEESAKGKAAGLAIPAGFDKAYATILDSSFTTLIAVSLLFMFGSGPVKGFAITIGIGIFTSIFTAVAVTRQMMGWATRNRSRQLLTFGNNWLNQSGLSRINFMRGRVVGLVASAILSIGSVILFVQPGLHYGVDFTGGTLIEMQSSTLSVEQVRDSLAEHQIEGASIQEFGEPGNYLIRVSQQNSDAGNTVNLVKNAISAKDSAASYPKVDMVGAKVSGGFADASILAVLIAGGGILLYLWLRFEQHFALAATATILLDLTKTIGFFALTGLEFNLTAVAAMLALIGYSINDKVVVFDRIREGFRANPDKPLLEVLNSSIGATLSRTVYTSATTFLALLPMGIAGGATVSSFALPMLFGIVIGTSSSVFIASPILYYLGRRREQRGLPQLKPTAEEIRASLAHIP